MARTQTFQNLETGLSVRSKLNSMTDWTGSYSYNVYDITHYNGLTYYSLVDGNIGNNPSSSPSSWISFSTLTSSFAKTASVAVSSPSCVLKSGDTMTGILDMSTGGGVQLENSSQGISFAGGTPSDFTIRIANNDILGITGRTDSVYISASNFIGTASVSNTLVNKSTVSNLNVAQNFYLNSSSIEGAQAGVILVRSVSDGGVNVSPAGVNIDNSGNINGNLIGSSSYSLTSSFSLNGGGGGGSGQVSQSLFATQSLYATSSISSSLSSTASYIIGLIYFSGSTPNSFPKWDGFTLTTNSNLYDDGNTVTSLASLIVNGNISCSVITASLFYNPSSIKTVVSDYTASTYDITILTNPTAAINIALPATNTNGMIYNIKNISTQTITVTPLSGKIDGQSSQIISTQYTNMPVQWSGSNWFIL